MLLQPKPRFGPLLPLRTSGADVSISEVPVCVWLSYFTRRIGRERGVNVGSVYNRPDHISIDIRAVNCESLPQQVIFSEKKTRKFFLL